MVGLREKKKVGYVLRITHKSRIKKVKPVLEVIDDFPLVDRNMFSLAREFSDYYACSWGEAIEATLPDKLRRTKKISLTKDLAAAGVTPEEIAPQALLLQDMDGKARFDIYIERIKEALGSGKTAVVLFPDKELAINFSDFVKIKLGIVPAVLFRQGTQELNEWIRIREGKASLAVGTRAAIFAPFNKPGLLIIDEEEDSIYKQDQVPHYNARQVAFMRANISRSQLILGSNSPSLESIYLARKNILKHILISRQKAYPEVRIVDSRRLYRPRRGENAILSRYLQDAVVASLNSNERVLIFLNRSGFATAAVCQQCGLLLKCPRCSVNLVYHFKDNILRCHYCNYRIAPPKVCPECKSGYIRYSGAGAEKIENEVARLFPGAVVGQFGSTLSKDLSGIGIFIATQHIIKHTDLRFGLVAVLNIDNTLNRVDFRSSEKAFSLLAGLLCLTEKKMIIQTAIPHHHCFSALEKKDFNLFYDEELKQRRATGFPPYRHFALLKLRSDKESKVRDAAESLYNKLNGEMKNKNLKVHSLSPGQPPKLRGNFYWQILVSASSAVKISKLLRIYLKDFSHSGIIVTVDIDPV